MPITKETKAANGITVKFHKVLKLEVDLRTDTSITIVASYPDEQAFLDTLPIAATWVVNLPFEALSRDGTTLSQVEVALTASPASPFYNGTLAVDKSESLETLKLRKNAEINRGRLEANRSSFTFQGKQIAFDELSQLDIATTNGGIALTGKMPDDWLGGWKAIDNTYVTIPDLSTWVLFYKAVETQGKANFVHAQELKAMLVNAGNRDEVASVKW